MVYMQFIGFMGCSSFLIQHPSLNFENRKIGLTDWAGKNRFAGVQKHRLGGPGIALAIYLARTASNQHSRPLPGDQKSTAPSRLGTKEAIRF